MLLLRYFHNKNAFGVVLKEKINKFIGLANTDLGITYRNGMFYPKGEEVLDQDLINHSLQTLAAYPNKDKDLRLALDNYKEGKKDGVIETCYCCL